MKTNSGISSLHSQTISVRYYSTGLPNRESNDLTEKFPFCSTVSEGNLGPFLISFSTQQPEPTERKKNTFEESEKSHSNTIGYCNATEIIADSLLRTAFVYDRIPDVVNMSQKFNYFWYSFRPQP